MPVPTTYPGVYIQEERGGPPTITGVSTSIALLIGMTARGRLDWPTRVLSFSDYEREFGTDTSVGEMTDQVRMFFQNGGREAYVMRIAQGAMSAQIDLLEETGSSAVLRLIALDAGRFGNSVRAEVTYPARAPESVFDLRIFRQVPDGSGGFDEVDEELHANLTMDPDAGRYAVDVVNNDSALVSAEPGPDVDTPALFAGYSLSGRIFTDAADLRTTLLDAIADTAPGGTGTVGGFRVWVDGQGPFDVEIESAEVPADPGDVEAFLTTSITNVLGAGLGVDVELVTGPAPGPLQYLRISSTDAGGGSVVIRSPTGNDITGALQLGVDRGGIEVDGFAARRPAPSGLFFRVGDFTADPVMEALTSLAGTDSADIDEYALDDDRGPHGGPVSFQPPPGRMYEDPAEDDSLVHLRRRLESVADQINEDATGDATFDWSAEVVGYRLVLRPESGVADTTGTIETGLAAGGGYDLGDAADANGLHAPNARYYALGAASAEPYDANAVVGFDGSTPSPDDYSDAYEIVRREVDLFNLLVLPRSGDQSDEDRARLWGPASAFCRDERAFLLVDPPRGWSDVNTIAGEIDDLRVGVVTDHAAVHWPRITIADPATGIPRQIDPSGSVAGLAARIDAERGVWKAPAGTEANLLGVRGVEHRMSDRENGVINPEAVNAIRLFPEGVVNWGARTMEGFDNSGTEYKYTPVRRTALFLEESLYRGLKWVVFEPNDEPLWAEIRLTVGAFMHDLFRQGAFQGATPGEAYFVKCDGETTTQTDIDRGVVNIWVGFAPLKPAEFVVLHLQQMAGQVQT